MNFRALRSMLTLLAALSVPLAWAGEKVDKAVEDALSKKLAIPSMGLVVESVSTSQLPGLYEVQYANGGPLVYATAKGEYFIVGDMYSVGPDGFVNLGEQRRDGQPDHRL